MDDQGDFEFQLQAEKESSVKTSVTTGQYVDPNDGTVYEWDHDRKGWFPKIDEDFLAVYQASYGVGEPQTQAVDTTKGKVSSENEKVKLKPVQNTEENVQTSSKQDLTESRKRKATEEQGWFDIEKEHNHNVYVSGLPLDITLEEFLELMRKCGIIMENEDGEPKVKLYEDINGELKGDGLCCFLKLESVALALQVLDESDIRGKKISVQKAQFQMKGDYNPTLKKKKKKGKKKKSKQEKLLDWRERKKADGPGRKKSDRIVIFKHLFDPKEFEENPMAINEIRDDLRAECEKFGVHVVKKILIFDRHPEGVGSVAFKDFEGADQCVSAMKGRWYGGQQLDVYLWDGITDLQIEETDQEREKRLENWQKFLEEGGEKEASS